jgi:hypothetical protein
MYKKPKVSFLIWPTNIKKLVVATVFSPGQKVLSTNYYSKTKL